MKVRLTLNNLYFPWSCECFANADGNLFISVLTFSFPSVVRCEISSLVSSGSSIGNKVDLSNFSSNCLKSRYESSLSLDSSISSLFMGNLSESSLE